MQARADGTSLSNRLQVQQPRLRLPHTQTHHETDQSLTGGFSSREPCVCR